MKFNKIIYYSLFLFMGFRYHFQNGFQFFNLLFKIYAFFFKIVNWSLKYKLHFHCPFCFRSSRVIVIREMKNQ